MNGILFQGRIAKAQARPLRMYASMIRNTGREIRATAFEVSRVFMCKVGPIAEIQGCDMAAFKYVSLAIN